MGGKFFAWYYCYPSLDHRVPSLNATFYKITALCWSFKAVAPSFLLCPFALSSVGQKLWPPMWTPNPQANCSAHLPLGSRVDHLSSVHEELFPSPSASCVLLPQCFQPTIPSCVETSKCVLCWLLRKYRPSSDYWYHLFKLWLFLLSTGKVLLPTASLIRLTALPSTWSAASLSSITCWGELINLYIQIEGAPWYWCALHLGKGDYWSLSYSLIKSNHNLCISKVATVKKIRFRIVPEGHHTPEVSRLKAVQAIPLSGTGEIWSGDH